MCPMQCLSLKSRLAPLPLFGTLRQLLVVLGNSEHCLLAFRIGYLLGMNARFLGAVAPMLRVFHLEPIGGSAGAIRGVFASGRAALPGPLAFPFPPSRLLAPAELCARRLGP